MITIKDSLITEEAYQLFTTYFHFENDFSITIEKGDKNEVKKEGNNIFIKAKAKVYVFRMLSLLFHEEKIEICENPTSSNLTYYMDCSRNGVVNFEFFKKFVLLLAALGYNRLGLYTEDTLEVIDEPYFGHLRGRYSVEEIKNMVNYADMFGIELIPAISTFAHVENIFFWSEYEKIFDCDDILLLEDERTYELIDHIFLTLSKAYKSREVHIGFDEAHRACLGRYFDKHQNVDRLEVVCKHLRRVLDIAKKYGFHASMWSDMFFRLEYNDYYPPIDAPLFSEKLKKLVPDDVKLIYWDYYHVDKAIYDKMFERHFELSNKVSFAGGSWNWLGYAPMNQLSISHALPAIKSCKDYHIDEIYVTAWGDNGNECSRLAVLPTMFLYSEYANANCDDLKNISKRLKQVTNLSLEDFYALDSVNDRPGNEGMTFGLSNPAKYLVYNDPLNGVFDHHISELDVTWTKKALNKIKKVQSKNTMFEHTFKTEEALCKMIIQKATIGNDIYKAYQEKDRESLKKLALKRIPKIKKAYKEFYEKLRTLWLYENKPFGFEVLQERLGYQFIRLDEAKRIISDYLNGKTDAILELEEPKLSQKYPWEDDRYVYKHSYKYIANVFMNK